jgi:hypothetical protein
MTVLNLRGGNGSGKTYVHHWLIDNHESEPLYSPNFFSDTEKKPNAWKLPGGLYLIGKYTAGADSILFQNLYAQVQAFAKEGHVFFENILVSGSKQAWLSKRRSMPDQDWVWATLDTSPETCIERIYARNGGKPIQEQTIIDFNNRIRKLATWLYDQGEVSVRIDHTDSVRQVHELLTKEGWNCGTTHQY